MVTVYLGAAISALFLVLAFGGNPLAILSRYAGIAAAVCGAAFVASLAYSALLPLYHLATVLGVK